MFFSKSFRVFHRHHDRSNSTRFAGEGIIKHCQNVPISGWLVRARKLMMSVLTQIQTT